MTCDFIVLSWFSESFGTKVKSWILKYISTMASIANEGELIIQSPEISSTIPSRLFVRPLNYCNIHRRRPLHPSLEPVLVSPNQENISSGFMFDFAPLSFNTVQHEVRVTKSPSLTDGQGEDSSRRAFIIVGVIFVTSLLALFYIYMMFPKLESREMQHIKIPWDIEDAKQLGRVLDRYKHKYFFEVLLAVIVTYIFLQTFAIPGSISLSILSGFLFPFPLALFLVCFCSATGASLCYVLSYFLGRRLVYKYFPEKATQWALTVNKHRGNLINYLLFLRMTPFLPNWFINITSPIIGVPLIPFWVGTFIGVAPPSFVAIQAGQTLYKLSASSDAWSWTSVILLGVFAVLSLVPVLLQKRLKESAE